MKKLLATILLCLVLMPLVFADGMVVIPKGYGRERGQLAFIDYNEDTKLEKMILSIQMDNIRGQKAAWVFPVPSSPNNVAIDVIQDMPRYSYSGREVRSYARNVIRNVKEGVLIFQIWPVFFFISPVMYSESFYSEGNAKDVSIETGQSVNVYEHIEKYGVTTELVGAEDGAAVRLYLVNKGLEVPFEANNVLRSYADKDYTFVVAWLDDSGSSPVKEVGGVFGEAPGDPDYYPNTRKVGVQVMFKTDQAYFPLLPTSVYGSEKVPATIYINGYVTPEVPEGIKSFTRTEYMKGYLSYTYESSGYSDEYTIVSINDAPSKFFTDDLWFSEGAPSNINYASSLVDILSDNEGKIIFVSALVLSLLLGSLLGFIIFRDQWWKLTLVSLANILTIIGLVIALFFVRTKNVDPVLKQRIKSAGLVTVSRDFRRKFIFLASFSVLFVVIAYLVSFLLGLPLN